MNAPARGSRHAIVLAVAALHALAIWQLSRHLGVPNRSAAHEAGAVTIILTPDHPAPRPKPAQVATEAAQSRHDKSPKSNTVDTARQTESIAITPPAVKNDAPNPTPANVVAQKALDDVGKVVGDMRKQGLLEDFSKLERKPDRFEKAISSAARVTETTMDSFTSDDGRVITRVSGPGGTYCVMTTLDSDPDGMDRAQRGPTLKKVPCSISK